MKSITKTIITFLFVVAIVPAVVAAQGNPKKGKYLYKKNCKACHSVGTQGVELTPMSKTMRQWDRFFKKDQHKDVPEIFEQLSEKDLRDIRQFLYDHAVDSPTPQTCG